jgi:hypothetical protein
MYMGPDQLALSVCTYFVPWVDDRFDLVAGLEERAAEGSEACGADMTVYLARAVDQPEEQEEEQEEEYFFPQLLS